MIARFQFLAVNSNRYFAFLDKRSLARVLGPFASPTFADDSVFRLDAFFFAERFRLVVAEIVSVAASALATDGLARRGTV
ncbi:MAG: hypothetical protein KDA38_09715, partial [Planctomycetales bacterium]|nr:hypothetical protein [Planctomycetales bacterium]